MFTNSVYKQCLQTAFTVYLHTFSVNTPKPMFTNSVYKWCL